MGKKATESEIKKIKKLRSKGLSYSTIAETVGRSESFVRKYAQGNKQGENLIGKKFNKLTVIKFDHNKNGRRYWLCKCECGNTHVVSTGDLKNGGVKSCGCIKRGTRKRREDLTGQKFGKLTVIEFVEIRFGQPYYKCKCDCGKEKIVNGYSLKRGLTRSCGCIKRATKNNQGGIYYFQPNDIQLKGSYEVKGNKRGGKVKKYKLNPTELAAYLKELETKEVQRRKV